MTERVLGQLAAVDGLAERFFRLGSQRQAQDQQDRRGFIDAWVAGLTISGQAQASSAAQRQDIRGTPGRYCSAAGAGRQQSHGRRAEARRGCSLAAAGGAHGQVGPATALLSMAEPLSLTGHCRASRLRRGGVWNRGALRPPVSACARQRAPSLAVAGVRWAAEPECPALGMSAKPKTFAQGLESVILCNKSLCLVWGQSPPSAITCPLPHPLCVSASVA